MNLKNHKGQKLLDCVNYKADLGCKKGVYFKMSKK